MNTDLHLLSLEWKNPTKDVIRLSLQIFWQLALDQKFPFQLRKDAEHHLQYKKIVNYICLIKKYLTLFPVISWPATRLNPLLSLDIFFLLIQMPQLLHIFIENQNLSLSSSLLSLSRIFLHGPVSACSSLDPKYFLPYLIRIK